MVKGYISMVMGKKLLVYHIAGWSAFIAYEVLTIHFVVGRTAPAIDYILHYLLNIALFYGNARLISSTKGRLTTGSLIALEIFVYMCCNYVLNTTLEHLAIQITRPTDPLRGFFIASFWRCLYFLGLSTMYGFAVNLIRSRDQMAVLMTAQVQREKDQAVLEKNLLTTQNALLRAQINPHLFFNTLNFIYNSVHRLSIHAGEAVMLLADITRYSISRGDSDGLVFLKDELTHVEDLISLNQIRFNGRLHIRLEMDGDFTHHKIIPLVLLTLVENVFKYGELEDPQTPAVVYIRRVDDIVHFATKNKKIGDKRHISSGGIGVANAKFRLEQAYPGQFTLRMNETPDMFFVDLSIKEECLCLAVIS